MSCGRLSRASDAWRARFDAAHKGVRSEEHTSELQSQSNLVCRLLLEKKKKTTHQHRRGKGDHVVASHATASELRPLRPPRLTLTTHVTLHIASPLAHSRHHTPTELHT